MRTITISLVGNSTIVKEVVNGGAPKFFVNNTSRELVEIDGGIKILAHPETNILNNYIIKVAELTNLGIDFTGVVTSEDLINKLAQQKCFKQGGWLGAAEVKTLNESNPNTNAYTDAEKADVAANKLKVTSKYTVSVIAVNTQAVANNLYVFTASLTLTLPLTPTAGDSIKISNRSTVATCVIARNGKNIMGIAMDMTLDNPLTSFELIYSGLVQGWVIIGIN